MASQVTTGRFVGRTQQLARLHQLLAHAVDGEPLIAVVGGEAGVGKTRLAEQLAAAARGQGVRVLGGGCVPLGEEGLPFAPVTQALRSLAADLDAAELAAVVGPARHELSSGRPAATAGWAVRGDRSGDRGPWLERARVSCLPALPDDPGTQRGGRGRSAHRAGQ